MIKKPIAFWRSTACSSPLTELYEFSREMEQDFVVEETKNLIVDKLPLFWDAKQSDGRKQAERFQLVENGE